LQLTDLGIRLTTSEQVIEHIIKRWSNYWILGGNVSKIVSDGGNLDHPILRFTNRVTFVIREIRHLRERDGKSCTIVSTNIKRLLTIDVMNFTGVLIQGLSGLERNRKSRAAVLKYGCSNRLKWPNNVCRSDSLSTQKWRECVVVENGNKTSGHIT
jgi:hypothetical protein